jgi:hypothetical protein
MLSSMARLVRHDRRLRFWRNDAGSPLRAPRGTSALSGVSIKSKAGQCCSVNDCSGAGRLASVIEHRGSESSVAQTMSASSSSCEEC